MFNAFIILVALRLGTFLAFSPRLAKSISWKATITPIASIIGGVFMGIQILGTVLRSERRMKEIYILSVVCQIYLETPSPLAVIRR